MRNHEIVEPTASNLLADKDVQVLLADPTLVNLLPTKIRNKILTVLEKITQPAEPQIEFIRVYGA